MRATCIQTFGMSNYIFFLFLGLILNYGGLAADSEPWQKTMVDEKTAKEIEDKLAKVLIDLEGIAETSPLKAVPVHIEPVVAEIRKMYPKLPPPVVPTRTPPKKDVCEEKYAYSKLNGDFPYFYKGFNMVNCTDAPKFSPLLTLLYNFVSYTEENLKKVPNMLKEVNKVYPGVAVIAAVPTGFAAQASSYKDVTLVTQEKSVPEMDVWKQLIDKATTKYVYIGRDVVHFMWFERLERLVREINNLDAYVVAGALRALISGHWTNGCDQSKLQNYTLSYRHGYWMSREECIFCNHVQGSFVSKKEAFKEFPLPSGMTAHSGFAMWFLQLSAQKKAIVSCPDSMTFVRDESRLPPPKQAWADLAKAMQIERIEPVEGSAIDFSCEEANSDCASTRTAGMALSRCCGNKLAAAIKTITSKCEQAGLLCALTNSTLLGAIKYNGLLPWQTNGEIALHIDHFASFETQLKSALEEKGYKLKVDAAKKQYEVEIPDWTIKVVTVSQAAKLAVGEKGRQTHIMYDGISLPAPESPGLSAKLRFGEALYRHGVGETASPTHFPKCPKPGHHACLDRFVADGNLS